MNLKPIKTEQDYNKALKRLELIFDAELGTKEGDELEILGILPNRAYSFQQLAKIILAKCRLPLL